MAATSGAVADMESTGFPTNPILFKVLTEYEPVAPVPRDQPEVKVKTVAPVGNALTTVQVMVDATAAFGGQKVGSAAAACVNTQVEAMEPVDVEAEIAALF